MKIFERLTIYTLIVITLSITGWAAAHASTAPNCEDHVEDDVIALACNVYWEARSESYEGMLAVVAVTMNRVAATNFPDTIRRVVWQHKQFSWTHDGLSDRPRNAPSWLQALAIAKRFAYSRETVDQNCPDANQINARILGRPDPGCAWYRTHMANKITIASLIDPTGGALFYHAEYVIPIWRSAESETARIGRHIFYAAARIRRN